MRDQVPNIHRPRREDGLSRSSELIAGLPNMSRVVELKAENTLEVQAFLSKRPVHTVVMASFIADNGIESELNRGKFYGYRGSSGVLEGVALIGHSTLVEARTPDALNALAIAARTPQTPIHLIMSSGDDARRFWDAYRVLPREPRLTCTEMLFELGFPFPVRPCEWEIRTATPAELMPVAEAQAEVAELECGVNPMQRDREGFLKRVMRRIEQGRVFVAFDGEKLVFKADIIAQTDDVIYLEGIYAGREYRGNGVGSRCLSNLCVRLIGSASSICVLSNLNFAHAHKSFARAGFVSKDTCVTLFI